MASLVGTDGDGNKQIYQLIAGRTANFPYVIYQELLDTAAYTFTALSADHVFYQIKALAVDANSSGPVIAGQIADRLRVLLTDPVLNVSGKTVLYCRFIRSIPAYAERDEAGDRYIYHRGGVYELWIA